MTDRDRLLELLALAQKTRAAQQRPSIRRSFLSGHDREVCVAYEHELEALLARLSAPPRPPEGSDPE